MDSKVTFSEGSESIVREIEYSESGQRLLVDNILIWHPWNNWKTIIRLITRHQLDLFTNTFSEPRRLLYSNSECGISPRTLVICENYFNIMSANLIELFWRKHYLVSLNSHKR